MPNDNTHLNRVVSIGDVFRVADEIRAEDVSDTLHLEEMENRLFILSRTPAPMNDNTHTQADWLYRTIAVNLLRATKAGESLHEFADRLERDIRDQISRTPAEPKAGDWEKEVEIHTAVEIHDRFQNDGIGDTEYVRLDEVRALSSAAPRITEEMVEGIAAELLEAYGKWVPDYRHAIADMKEAFLALLRQQPPFTPTQTEE